MLSWQAMRTVATYGTLEEALLARARLEDSGIKAFLPDEFTASSGFGVFNAIGGIRLQVEDEDLPLASQVLGLDGDSKDGAR
jgi:hypothetical protein